MTAPIYCYSVDGENYNGDFDTREDALDGAAEDLAYAHEPGSEVTVYTGVQVHAMHTLRRCEKWLGDNLLETLDEWVADDIAADDRIIEMTPEATAALSKLILDYVEQHATFNRWGVDDVQEHKVVVGEEAV